MLCSILEIKMKFGSTILVQKVIVPFSSIRCQIKLIFLQFIIKKTRLVRTDWILSFGSIGNRVTCWNVYKFTQRLLSFFLAKSQLSKLTCWLSWTLFLKLNIIKRNAIFRFFFRLGIEFYRSVSNITIFFWNDKSFLSLAIQFEIEPFKVSDVLFLSLIDSFPTDYSE